MSPILLREPPANYLLSPVHTRATTLYSSNESLRVESYDARSNAQDVRPHELLNFFAFTSQLKQITSFYFFAENWDGYGSSKPDHGAIHWSKFYLRRLHLMRFVPYFCICTADDRILIEVATDGTHYRMEVDRSRNIVSRQTVRDSVFSSVDTVPTSFWALTENVPEKFPLPSPLH